MLRNMYSKCLNLCNSVSSSQHDQNMSNGGSLTRGDAIKIPSAADSAANRKALEARSRSQRQRLINLFHSSSGKETRDEIKKLLLGQAIKPEVAEKYMNSVEFDGIGRICGFKKNLSSTALRELQSAVTISLTKTNTADEREDARPGRDCMIQFMHLLQNVKGEAAQELLKEVKNQWMSGNLSDDNVSRFFAGAAKKLAEMPALQAMATELSQATSKTKEFTQHNDNMYGRKFESEFVHTLIKSPPAGTMDASRKIGQALLADFNEAHKRANSDNISKNLQDMAKTMELRPWFNEVPDLKRFVEEPTSDNLKAMLLNVNHGFDIIKVQYLVSKVSKFFFEEIGWKCEADLRYRSLQPERSTRPFQEISGKQEKDGLGLMMQTSGYGIGLANHPDYEKYDTFQSAKNITYQRMIPNLNEATEAEQQRLRHGHSVVTGLSGSTNLLNSLSLKIAETDKNFSTEQAMLAGMMFFVFDGGHSLNEIMAVHTAITSSENVTPSKAAQETSENLEKTLMSKGASPNVAKSIAKTKLNNEIRDAKREAFTSHLKNYHHLDYSTIIELARHGGSDKDVSAAMDTALSKVVDYFERNSYYMSRNEDLLGKISSTQA